MKVRIFGALLVTLSGLHAQAATTQAREPEPAGRALTKAQVAERLEKCKGSLLPQVWPAKCDKDAEYRRQYLSKWQAVTSDHYLVFTDGPTASCRKYAVTLEELYRTIQQQIPFADLDHPLVAYIFADREDYYRFAEKITGYSAAGARATAGHATSLYYATYYTSPRSAVVYHEAAHQIVGACLRVPGVGSWFQEGIAVYFEKKMTNERPQGNAKNDIRHGDWYPLAEFFAIPVLLSDPAGHGRRNYDHAGALLEFMIDTKLAPVAGRFEEFLAAAREGRGFGRGKDTSIELIRKAYGLELAEFETLWLEHLGARTRGG